MKINLLIILLLSSSAWAANYVIEPGTLHEKSKAQITVLPDAKKFIVKMGYQLKKKSLVPLPKKFLEDEKIMDFPAEFRTEAGYKKLEKLKRMQINKAELVFLKRGPIGKLENAYFLEVRPTNKKSKIQIIYHPSLPDTGWSEITITMISAFPLLDGYELNAKLVK